MCGIIGYTGSRQARGLLSKGSAAWNTRLRFSRCRSSRRTPTARASCRGAGAGLAATVPTDLSGTTGIAHTRWATHGGVTLENAHPHMDMLQRIAVVHNGIIENMGPLKTRLEAEGVRFRSETDSEVLAHLIARFYEGQGALDDSISPDAAAGDPLEAVRAALARVRGPGALPWSSPTIRTRSSAHAMALLSWSASAMARPSSRPIPTRSRPIRGGWCSSRMGKSRLDPSGVQTQRLDGGAHQTVIEELAEDWGDAEKGDFPHFMLKEIHEQPEALRQCLGGRVLVEDGTAKLSGLDLSPRELVGIRAINLLGCGTAFHACLVGANIIEQVARVPARACVASEFGYSNPVIDPSDLFFAVSQSGETADTLGAVKEIQLEGRPGDGCGQRRRVVDCTDVWPWRVRPLRPGDGSGIDEGLLEHGGRTGPVRAADRTYPGAVRAPGPGDGGGLAGDSRPRRAVPRPTRPGRRDGPARAGREDGAVPWAWRERGSPPKAP